MQDNGRKDSKNEKESKNKLPTYACVRAYVPEDYSPP